MLTMSACWWRCSAQGSTYLSNARVGGKFALRGCVLNYRTTKADMARVWICAGGAEWNVLGYSAISKLAYGDSGTCSRCLAAGRRRVSGDHPNAQGGCRIPCVTPGLTVGSTFTSNGFSAIPVSLSENTGPAQVLAYRSTGNVQLSGNGQVPQAAAGSSTPGVVSVTPNQGTGSSPAFALQAYDAAGYSNIAELDLAVIGADGSECRAAMGLSGGTDHSLLGKRRRVFRRPDQRAGHRNVAE